MMRLSRRLTLLALILGAGLPARAALQVGPVSDPAGDFRPSNPSDPNAYAGPPNTGLDVLSANVLYDPVQGTLTFTSTMAGPIAGLLSSTGANLGSFSWGINHGAGTLNFATIGLPNVLFDSVLALNPNETGSFGQNNPTPAGSVRRSGNTLTAVLPVSFLDRPGSLPVTQWSFNLWPRANFTDFTNPGPSTAISFGNAQIADFAPDAIDFTAQVVPEPSSLVALGTGLLSAGLVVLLGRPRRRRAVAA